MNRPADFTDAERRACDAEMDRFRAMQRADPASVPRSIPDGIFDNPLMRELWYAGMWLEKKLRAAGCDRVAAKTICHVNGQACPEPDGIWDQTRHTLAYFLSLKGKPR